MQAFQGNSRSTTSWLSPVFLSTVIMAVLGCYPLPSNSASSDNIPSFDELQDGKRSTGASLKPDKRKQQEGTKVKTATFGAGCFWCVEAVFQELDGVLSVKSGYTGGFVNNPTYEQICTGNTGHAEVCRIEYDPSKIEFKDLLEVFWKTHDPTTLNQQGVDRGTQYRSAIFYHDDEQRDLANKYKQALNEAGAFRRPVVTEIVEAATFFPCEKYHDNYFKDNPNARYCRAVIQPKMKKFRKAFADKLKQDNEKGKNKK